MIRLEMSKNWLSNSVASQLFETVLTKDKPEIRDEECCSHLSIIIKKGAVCFQLMSSFFSYISLPLCRLF